MATLDQLVDSYKRVIVERTLIENDYDRKKTAEALGLNRIRLWELLRKYKIKAPFGGDAARAGWSEDMPRAMWRPTVEERKRKKEEAAEDERNWVEPPDD